MEFLQSLAGEYMALTFLYSLVIAVVVESLLRLWHLSTPEVALKFRLLVLILPGVYWAIYQLTRLLGEGESLRQRLVLFKLDDWLIIEIAKGIFVGHLLLLIFGFTALFFLFQEVLPLVRSRFSMADSGTRINEGRFPKLDAALADLKARGKSTPPIFLTNQREPVACTVGTFKPVLLLSPSLIAAMDERELKGVLAHEMAHLQKGDNWKSWILLALRSSMFFNPVALIVFRKLTQENEKVCDDLAVRATREPLALASGVLKVFRSGVDDPDLSSGVKGKLLSWGESLDHRARAQATEERVARLLQTTDFKAVAWEEIRIGLVVISMFVLLFLVM